MTRFIRRHLDRFCFVVGSVGLAAALVVGCARYADRDGRAAIPGFLAAVQEVDGVLVDDAPPPWSTGLVLFVLLATWEEMFPEQRTAALDVLGSSVVVYAPAADVLDDVNAARAAHGLEPMRSACGFAATRIAARIAIGDGCAPLLAVIHEAAHLVAWTLDGDPDDEHARPELWQRGGVVDLADLRARRLGLDVVP